jgi:hypothetical protein
MASRLPVSAPPVAFAVLGLWGVRQLILARPDAKDTPISSSDSEKISKRTFKAMFVDTLSHPSRARAFLFCMLRRINELELPTAPWTTSNYPVTVLHLAKMETAYSRPRTVRCCPRYPPTRKKARLPASPFRKNGKRGRVKHRRSRSCGL